MKKEIEKILRNRINTNNEDGWKIIDASEENLKTLINELSQALTLGGVVNCKCKTPEPRMKNSENGISTYCSKCARNL